MKLATKLGALAVLLLVPLPPATAAAAPPAYEAFGSCATAKPFPPAGHCGFDRPEHARATIVFRSHTGKRSLRVCQRIYGLSFIGRQCLKTEEPVAYEAIPFELKGAYDKFKLVVDLYAKGGSARSYERVGHVVLRFSP